MTQPPGKKYEYLFQPTSESIVAFRWLPDMDMVEVMYKPGPRCGLEFHIAFPISEPHPYYVTDSHAVTLPTTTFSKCYLRANEISSLTKNNARGLWNTLISYDGWVKWSNGESRS